MASEQNIYGRIYIIYHGYEPDVMYLGETTMNISERIRPIQWPDHRGRGVKWGGHVHEFEKKTNNQGYIWKKI